MTSTLTQLTTQGLPKTTDDISFLPTLGGVYYFTEKQKSEINYAIGMPSAFDRYLVNL